MVSCSYLLQIDYGHCNLLLSAFVDDAANSKKRVLGLSKGFSKVMKASSQVPLTLAWALSIHKSQGQTLSYVRINMKNMFAAGESYSYFTCSLD